MDISLFIRVVSACGGGACHSSQAVYVTFAGMRALETFAPERAAWELGVRVWTVLLFRESRSYSGVLCCGVVGVRWVSYGAGSIFCCLPRIACLK